jgi:hypothetical protein
MRQQSLNIEIKKTRNGKHDAMRLVRPDGANEWSPLHKGMVNHDLAHFVVESYFSLQLGFYGEILSGTTMETMRSQAVTQVKNWSPDIFIAETLAGSFQNALTTGQDFASFCDSFQANRNQAEVLIRNRCSELNPRWPDINERTFTEVCAKIIELWRTWENLETGDKLKLVWMHC